MCACDPGSAVACSRYLERNNAGARLVLAMLLGAVLCAATGVHAEDTSDVFVMLRPPQSSRGHDLAARRRAVATQHLRVAKAVRHRGVQVRETLGTISGFTAAVTVDGLAALRQQPDVLRVDAMRYGSGGLDRSVPQIRADAVARRDDQGQGVTVAVLDTGVQTTHPDLIGRVVAEECFCSGGCCPNGASRQSGSGSAFTTFVHGMHVTGIVASQGLVAPRGVAPRVNIVSVKVLNDENRGSLFDWVRGLQWILDNRPDVQVINMSLVSDATYPGFCDDSDSFNMAFAQAITQLRARGTLTFVSSGNTGDLNEVTSPACVRDAIAVGATERDGSLADFTSRSSAIDLLAPGSNILSDAPDGGTARLTGTSMASPHAAGTAALLLAWHPLLAPDEIESILKRTGMPVADPFSRLVVPRINALAAFTAMQPASQPFLGGGSGRTDCLLEWHASPAATVRVAPRLQVACRDGDPACDLDSIPGQCTLNLTLCLNEPDTRLPRCASALQITGYQLTQPPPNAGNLIDRSNATAIASALPQFPVEDADVCTLPIAMVVPVGTPKPVRLKVTAGDGRRDIDRAVLLCQP